MAALISTCRISSTGDVNNCLVYVHTSTRGMPLQIKKKKKKEKRRMLSVPISIYRYLYIYLYIKRIYEVAVKVSQSHSRYSGFELSRGFECTNLKWRWQLPPYFFFFYNAKIRTNGKKSNDKKKTDERNKKICLNVTASGGGYLFSATGEFQRTHWVFLERTQRGKQRTLCENETKFRRNEGTWMIARGIVLTISVVSSCTSRIIHANIAFRKYTLRRTFPR